MLGYMGIPAVHSVQIKIKDKKVDTDIDVLAVYENALILVECCGKEKIGKKIKIAASNFELIRKNLRKLSEIVKKQFKTFYEKTERIWERIEKGQEIVIKNILFTTLRLKAEERELIKKYGDVYLMDFDDYSYFNHLSTLTFDHARYEFLIFLEVKPEEVGDKITLKSPLIKGKIVEESKDRDIVVFVHSPDFLLRTTHVRRLYSWDPQGFQRLLIKRKMRKLVEFLKKEKESFPNNIIVATHKDRIDYEPNYRTRDFTIKFNDFSYDIFVLIDGQHRLYAFASSDEEIKKLRENISLIVTAIIFKDINEKDSIKKMAELFYTINTTYTRINPATSIDLQETLWPDRAIPKANKLLRRLNSKEGTFLFKKIEFSPYDKEYFGKKLLPRATLITYTGLKEFFVEKSKSYEIFNNVYSYLKDKFDNYEDFILWILNIYLKAIESALKEIKGEEVTKQLLEDTELKEYYFMTVTVIGALFRLLRHFLSPDNHDDNVKKLLQIIKDQKMPLEQKEDSMKQIIKDLLKHVFRYVEFSLEEWENKGWKSSQWALVEREMISILREHYNKNFGDEHLIKKTRS